MHATGTTARVVVYDGERVGVYVDDTYYDGIVAGPPEWLAAGDVLRARLTVSLGDTAGASCSMAMSSLLRVSAAEPICLPWGHGVSVLADVCAQDDFDDMGPLVVRSSMSW